MAKLSVLLADDHQLFREGLAGILNAQPDFTVAGEASDGLEAVVKSRQLQPDLVIMDGVEAFVNGGPAKGKVVSPSVVLASNDPVAIDAVGVALLRLLGTTPQVSRGKVFEQEQIARAVELGLGINSPERIKIVTGDAPSEAYANQIGRFLT